MKAPTIRVGYDDRWMAIDPTRPFGIGRATDLSLDDNEYLHRQILLVRFDRFWTISNVGTRLSATLADIDGALHAWLRPGAMLPLVTRTTEVRFTAGSSSYRLLFDLDEPLMTSRPERRTEALGAPTLSPEPLTHLQRLLILSLAEPTLRSPSTATTELPPSAQAARRLGWTITKFNRQLDAVCRKLGRSGVPGLHGDLATLASNRRSRLVEYAVITRLVTVEDLLLLDPPDDHLP